MPKAFDIILNALRVELGIEKEPARTAFPPPGRSGQRTKTERDSYGQESGSQYGRRPDAGLESRIEVIPAPDLEKAYRLARFHSVEAMTYKGLRKAGITLPADLGARWKNDFEKETIKGVLQLHTHDQVLELLTSHGIDCLPLKGCLLKEMYPHLDDRQMADLDILVSNPEAAERLLLEQGYSCIVRNHVEEVYIKPPYLNIEIHKKLFSEDAQPKESEFFCHVWDMAQEVCPHRYRLSWDDFYLYFLCHMRKHYDGGGTGIRSVMDTYVFLKKHGQDLQEERISQACQRLGLTELRENIESLAKLWFGSASDFDAAVIPQTVPLQATGGSPEAASSQSSGGRSEAASSQSVEERSNKADRERLREVSDYILSSGTYGTVSHHVENDVARYGHVRYLLRRLFPSKAYMADLYPVTAGRPYLLPLFYLVRIVTRTSSRTGEMQIFRDQMPKKTHSSDGNPVKRIYERSQRSFLAPMLSPVFMGVCSLEYHFLNTKWRMEGNRWPSGEERRLVRKNVTFIVKSFERQKMVRGLCQNISRIYPGVQIIVADDSRTPLQVPAKNVRVIHLPFNSGLSAGLCAALDAVQTPYTVRLDDDDLLTVRTNIHRELRYLMQQEKTGGDGPKIDLISFGTMTAPRLHSLSFNLRQYLNQPMTDAPRKLLVPHGTRVDENHLMLGKVMNNYICRTDRLRQVGFDPKIRMIDHHEFFWRAAGVLTSAVALDTVIFHRHNPYDRNYFRYRNDYQGDLEYIRKKRRKYQAPDDSYYND